MRINLGMTFDGDGLRRKLEQAKLRGMDRHADRSNLTWRNGNAPPTVHLRVLSYLLGYEEFGVHYTPFVRAPSHEAKALND